MFDLARRFRGFAIAIIVLAMTAGVAFAASPGGPRWSWSPASLDALFGGPKTAVQGNEQGDDQGDASQPPESEAPDATDAPESEAPESEAPESEAPEASNDANNHGTLVSTAANMTTPDGFANHGAFVRCVAHMKNVDPATFDWTTVTPASCADAWGHAPGSHGHHGHRNDH